MRRWASWIIGTRRYLPCSAGRIRRLLLLKHFATQIKTKSSLLPKKSFDKLSWHSMIRTVDWFFMSRQYKDHPCGFSFPLHHTTTVYWCTPGICDKLIHNLMQRFHDQFTLIPRSFEMSMGCQNLSWMSITQAVWSGSSLVQNVPQPPYRYAWHVRCSRWLLSSLHCSSCQLNNYHSAFRSTTCFQTEDVLHKNNTSFRQRRRRRVFLLSTENY